MERRLQAARTVGLQPDLTQLAGHGLKPVAPGRLKAALQWRCSCLGVV